MTHTPPPSPPPHIIAHTNAYTNKCVYKHYWSRMRHYLYLGHELDILIRLMYIYVLYGLSLWWCRECSSLIMICIIPALGESCSKVQPIVQAQIKENIKAPRRWPLCGNSPVTDGFPSQRASNAEKIPFDDVILSKLRFTSAKFWQCISNNSKLRSLATAEVARHLLSKNLDR